VLKGQYGHCLLTTSINLLLSLIENIKIMHANYNGVAKIQWNCA
jgi:hypothetical protein